MGWAISTAPDGLWTTLDAGDTVALVSRPVLFAVDEDEGSLRAIEVRTGTEVVGGEGEGRLTRLSLRDRGGGAVETVEADALFLMIGARPNTGWLPADVLRDERGFLRTGADLADAPVWPLDRAPLSLELFAAGRLTRQAS